MRRTNAPNPNPALKSLAKLLGTWTISGEATGRVSFKWMEGGFFMVQDIDMAGINGIEFIGYDECSRTLRSHYFDSRGAMLESIYYVSDTEHIILVDMPGIKWRFSGKFSNDGSCISGDWKWKKDDKELEYQLVFTRSFSDCTAKAGNNFFK
jgi:hypothetical protein